MCCLLTDLQYLVLDPQLKTAEWYFKELVVKASYTFESASHGEVKWSFEVEY